MMSAIWSWFISWGWWLLAILATFGIHEGWAIVTKQQTLTNFVRTETARIPIVIFILGILVGGAAVHFWGYGWCPS
jgi:hypothetical protein